MPEEDGEPEEDQNGLPQAPSPSGGDYSGSIVIDNTIPGVGMRNKKKQKVK
jgi:hypothetical protein